MDDYDVMFYANMLLQDRLTLEMKRGHLHEYLDRVGITDDSPPAALKQAFERLTYCLGTKSDQARVARSIEELLTQRYTH